jgi:large subunit ribosomal protein L3
MLKGLIGKKIGMTQIFDEQGVAYTVTLIEAGPCYVTQVRTPEKEGYSSVQLGFGEVNPKRLRPMKFPLCASCANFEQKIMD